MDVRLDVGQPDVNVSSYDVIMDQDKHATCVNRGEATQGNFLIDIMS